MVMMGPPGGGAFGGPSATQSSASAGLPFAGVPSEMQDGASEILKREPVHPEPEFTFHRLARRTSRLNLRSLFENHYIAALWGLFLLAVETITALMGPVLTQQGIDNGVMEQDRTSLYMAVTLFGLIIVINAATSFLRQRWNGKLGEDIMYDVRLELFSHFQRMGLDWYTSEKSGVLLSRMTSDVEALTLLVNEGFVNLVIQALTISVVTFVLFSYNPFLAVLLLGLVLPPLVVMTLWFRAVSERGYSDVRDRIAVVLADLSENLAGVRVIAALNRRRQNAESHRNVVGAYLDANLYTARAGAIYGPITEGIGIAAQAIVLLVGGWMVVDGSLQVGELTAFVLFVNTFFAPIQQMVQLYNTYQQGQSGLKKIGDILSTEPSIVEADNAVSLPPIQGQIKFESVTFRYNDGPEVLRDIDLTINPGETFAFVGPTGAGKSTIAKLITSFYDPISGVVSIDGHDLRGVLIDSLRTQLGVVPQEPFLFHGTIRDNVAFARGDATEEEVNEAISHVGLTEAVARLGDGIDTLVHERGVSLSAGERQLIALARAFISRPRVLVLDEATSSLDLRSEAHIETALDGLLEGRTAILIAHRLATAMKADRIAVIDDGQIIELGSHDELIQLGGRYAEMFETWSSHSETEESPPLNSPSD
ncbi:MAG: ABC transporter ATP-binding protein [Acidimicrobiales bacterium]|nr:ABC transporter ATP-binding protein [Acidimicrobiales bacterium]